MKFYRTGFFAAIALLCITFLSCSPKTPEFTGGVTEAQELIFQQARYHKTGVIGNSRALKFYYPPEMDKFLFRTWLENGETIYLIEKYYPNCKGIIDSDAFYSEACDSGDWVDSVIDEVEEERLGSELIDLLENELEIQPPVDFSEILEDFEEIENSDESETILEVSDDEGDKENADGKDSKTSESESKNTVPVEKRVLDSQSRLKFMEYSDEILVMQAQNKDTVIIHGNGSRVVRSFYDERCRLIKKEIWSIPDIEKAKLLSKEEIGYLPENNKVRNRKITADNKIIDYNYDEMGRGISVKIYEIENDLKLLTKSSTWEYSGSGKILEEENIENTYSDGKLVTSNSKKEKYTYLRQQESDPEKLAYYEYYENGILKIKTNYSENSYTTKIDFDDNYSVISYYENGKKVKDVYTIGGIVRRTKIYE